MLKGLDASDYGKRFHLNVLSDTNDAEIGANEETYFSELNLCWRDRVAVTYRRRTANTGYKAGNIRDFCEQWGSGHKFAAAVGCRPALARCPSGVKLGIQSRRNRWQVLLQLNPVCRLRRRARHRGALAGPASAIVHRKPLTVARWKIVPAARHPRRP